MKKLQKKKPITSPITFNQKSLSQSYQINSLKNAYFPYQPYPQQRYLISQIHHGILKGENILAESPTGTGKTLCVLIASISALMTLQSDNKGHKQKIFYLTRTHSQVSQVISQLKKTVYQLDANTLASRQSMCINQNLQSLKGRNLDRACQEMCNQKLCKYKEDLEVENKKHGKKFKGMMTVQDFKEKGKKEFFCPYYATKQATQHSNLTVLPYNYFLDWNLFQKYHLNIRNAVIIFDQAHNIDSLAEQGSSFELPIDILGNSISQISKLEQQMKCRYLHKKFQSNQQQIQVVSRIKYSILNFQNQLKNLKQSLSENRQQKIVTNINQMLQVLKQLTSHTNPDTGIHFNGLDLTNYEDYLEELKILDKIFQQKKAISEFYTYYVSFFNKVYRILDSDQFQDYILILSYPKNGFPSLKFQCLNAAYTFQRISSHKPRSIILCSGTLSPLQSWEQDLGIKFQYKVKVKSFIKESQLFSIVLSHNNKNEPYDFSFQMKNRTKQYESLADQFSKIEQIVPNGIVVAFSTYQILEKTIPLCLKLKKKVFYESKTANMDQVYRKYSQQCEKNGAFLFIIMKGRFSEGINFNNELCRCLFIVGIPFLPMFDMKISRKKAYIQSKYGRQAAGQWYLNQTFRVVNQALGRVIRSKNDFGCIILVDQRFRRQQIMDELSDWFRCCLKSDTRLNINEEIKRFFTEKRWQLRLQHQINNQIKSEMKQKNTQICPFESQLDKTIHSGALKNKSLSLEELLQQQTPVKQKKKKLKIIQDEEDEQKQGKDRKNKNKNKRLKALSKQISSTQSQNIEENEDTFRSYFPWLSVDNFFLNNMNTDQPQQKNQNNSANTSEINKQSQKSNNQLEYLKFPKKINHRAYF